MDIRLQSTFFMGFTNRELTLITMGLQGKLKPGEQTQQAIILSGQIVERRCKEVDALKKVVDGARAKFLEENPGVPKALPPGDNDA